MKTIFMGIITFFFLSSTVNAHQNISFSYLDEQPKTQSHNIRTIASKQHHITKKYNAGPRPSRWCGWYLRSIFSGGPEYNVARNWAKRGTPARGPRVGAVVVWAHHVGVIVGKAANGQWLVHSGNTSGGKIATKPRSVAGAIAFRMI